jgi:uncharacterized protein
MAEPDRPTVVDDRERHRFVLVEDGVEAELVYRARPDRLILVHTGVPDEVGGRGLAGDLVRAAVERAAAEGLTVVPWCPYTRAWLRDHPDEAASVDIDWTPPRRHRTRPSDGA